MSVGLVGWVEVQVAHFRERAALLARSGANEAGACWERAAEELESAFRAWWLAELPVSEAATESGFSPERLRELVREGRVTGQRDGERGAIRLRRCDLPRKPGTPAPPLQAVASRLGIK